MQDKLEKLKKLLEVANDGIGKADFEKNFKVVLDFVKKLQITLTENNNKAVNELTNLIETLSKKLENLNKETLIDYNAKISKALKEQEIGMNFIRDKVRSIKHGVDGKDSDPKEVAVLSSKMAITAILDRVVAKDGFKEEIGKAGDLIVNTISGLLEVSDIKGLEELLKKNKTFGGGGGLRPAPTGVETPTGDINSVNKAYVVVQVPQFITLQGQTMYPDNGFVLSSTAGVLTITLDDAPITNSLLRSHY